MYLIRCRTRNVNERLGMTLAKVLHAPSADPTSFPKPDSHLAVVLWTDSMLVISS